MEKNKISNKIKELNQSIDESSYLLGHSKLKTFSLIHIPYLKKSNIKKYIFHMINQFHSLEYITAPHK